MCIHECILFWIGQKKGRDIIENRQSQLPTLTKLIKSSTTTAVKEDISNNHSFVVACICDVQNRFRSGGNLQNCSRIHNEGFCEENDCRAKQNMYKHIKIGGGKLFKHPTSTVGWSQFQFLTPSCTFYFPSDGAHNVRRT